MFTMPFYQVVSVPIIESTGLFYPILNVDVFVQPFAIQDSNIFCGYVFLHRLRYLVTMITYNFLVFSLLQGKRRDCLVSG
jgi:hypothetical protein